ncbi:MAG: hypothetical protein U1F87_05835 [Kiritimatiellia bacterium]
MCGALFALWILSRTRPATERRTAMRRGHPRPAGQYLHPDPLMDGEVERSATPKHSSSAPALLAALFLLFRHAPRVPPEHPRPHMTPHPPHDTPRKPSSNSSPTSSCSTPPRSLWT